MNSVKNHKALSATIFTLLILTTGVGTSMSWFGLRSSADPSTIEFSSVDVSRLTTSGREIFATISPDGKYLAHVTNLPNGNRALMLRQVATDNNRTLLEGKSDLWILPPVFSPDGNYIYCASFIIGGGPTQKPSLVRIPALGGDEVQISDDFTRNPFDVAPDGDHVVYSSRGADGNIEVKVSSLRAMISQTDKPVILGHIAQRSGAAFSPDGKRVSIPFSDPSTRKHKVAIYDISGKPPATINTEFSEIGSAVWFTNSNLLITARRTEADRDMQIWRLGLDGSATQLTTEVSNYGHLSITADRSTAVATQSRTGSNLYIASSPVPPTRSVEANGFRQVTRESGVQFGTLGVAWTPDQRLIYSYTGLDRAQLRIMNADGSNNRQLTNEKFRNPASPNVTPDGKYLLFNAENEREEMYLWRMDLGSGSVIPLAFAGPWTWYQGFTITPDSRSVIYAFVDPNWKNLPVERLTGGLKKISIDGGDATDFLIDNTFPMPQISPDGKLLGIITQDGRLGVIPMDNLKAAPKFFDTSKAPPDLGRRSFGWSRDSRALIYPIDSRKTGTSYAQNLRRLPVDGSEAGNVTNFTDSQGLYSFAYTPDGKKLAVARGVRTSDVVLVKNVR